MSNNSTNYTIKNIETNNKTESNSNTSIRRNLIYAIASFALAGVAFGVGDQLFASTSLQNIVAFGSIGISCANIRALRENLKLKSETQEKKYSKGK